MNKYLRGAIRAIPAVITLFRKKTPEEGKVVAKSGVTSLTIAGLISTGRLATGEMDSTLLIVLAILEAIGYLYGLVALSSGASQTCPEEDLLDGKADGLTSEEAIVLGREWIRLKQQKQLQEMNAAKPSLPNAQDLSNYNQHNP